MARWFGQAERESTDEFFLDCCNAVRPVHAEEGAALAGEPAPGPSAVSRLRSATRTATMASIIDESAVDNAGEENGDMVDAKRAKTTPAAATTLTASAAGEAKTPLTAVQKHDQIVTQMTEKISTLLRTNKGKDIGALLFTINTNGTLQERHETLHCTKNVDGLAKSLDFQRVLDSFARRPNTLIMSDKVYGDQAPVQSGTSWDYLHREHIYVPDIFIY
jgi:hypothetical protein